MTVSSAAMAVTADMAPTAKQIILFIFILIPFPFAGLNSSQAGLEKEAPEEKRPGHDGDELVPGKEPIVPSPAHDHADGTENRVMAHIRDVPNGMQEATAHGGLQNIEETHDDKGTVIAHAIVQPDVASLFRF